METRVTGLIFLLLAAGCCQKDEPDWDVLPPLTLVAGQTQSLDLNSLLISGEDAVFSVEAQEGVIAELSGTTLSLTPEPGFEGTTSVVVTATASCERTASVTQVLTIEPVLCPTTFHYTPRAGGAPKLAGSFNDWQPTPMEATETGYALTIDLAPGPWTYKFIELSNNEEAWSCDPENGMFQCDVGYSWDASCPVGGGGCNSLVVVPDCSLPVLALTALNISETTVSADVSVSGVLSDAYVTLDGNPVEGGTGFSVSISGLSPGRHSLRFGGKAADGRAVEEVYVPFWTDGGSWEQGLLYFVFVDRFADGDPSNNAPEGASATYGDYLGGDWQGVIDRMDYLESLGVTAIWLTAPLDNAQGPWTADCGQTVTGYHGYWPTGFGPEEHFGDEATLKELISAAHTHNIRVLVDLVGNHVHEDHPWLTEHPDWFNPRYICQEDEDGNGVQNWDQRPETCWFASYLPDIDYYQPAPLTQVVEDAIDFAKTWEIDGFRVDAVKHMPYALHSNLAARLEAEVEHKKVGGSEDFYLVGETFTGDYGLIDSYTGAGMLDGQFDFPMYWTLIQAFARNEIGLSNGDGSLMAQTAQSRQEFAGRLMSTFLGNHDVWRFIAHANGEVGSLYGDGNCDGNNQPRDPDQPPTSEAPYARLKLAWTYLLTNPGLPLIYYGDEVGLPGYGDPDNRQPMRFDGALSAYEASVLEHVSALGQARQDHPALSGGIQADWWTGESDVYAYARVQAGDAALVLINRGLVARTLSNGLAFAGLSQGMYQDVLSGKQVSSVGDSLSVTLDPQTSMVLVYQP